MAEYNLKRGFDIKLVGEAESVIDDGFRPETIALNTGSLRGVKLKPLVKPGDTVKIGSPLCQSKENDAWVFTSPNSGTVKEVIRGARRVLESFVIQVDNEYESILFDHFKQSDLSTVMREDAMELLLMSGQLANFRERPFDYTANPEHMPRDIFVSTFDTAPLAADPNMIVEGNEVYFQAGLDICSVLTSGKVHLGIDSDRKDISEAFAHARNVQVNRFSGPHPAGLVGVQIHHVAPINGREDYVWTISVHGLIQIGRLFTTGNISPDMIVAVAGAGASNRKHFRTVLGAPIDSLVELEEGEQRIISGNVLTGKKVDPENYIGFYDNLITVIPEVTSPEFIGWMLPGGEKQSYFKAFLSHMFPGKKFNQNTCMNGGDRAFVSTGLYEDVLPMDIYPLYLVKSIRAGDIDEMEQLGIYEVSEEELALCEYICPSKGTFMKDIRNGLDLIEKEG
ncbi:MAG: Na(+)-translocating NADH-quinone reductase subunit A [Lentisphaeria bacterium]|nr:Na(+)-translocating NADH-quinone reductase subunit A [Lentisphaeria bacterium]NQZ66734.1 Na(+)-translocating NADH-quinone reductase subunit A [Lentisphaeria bacterium]